MNIPHSMIVIRMALIAIGICCHLDAAESEIERLAREVTPLFKTASAEAGNLARGKICRYYPNPGSVGHCRSDSDPYDLTDGKILDNAGGLWFCEGTVGWVRVPGATITVDLGAEQAIDRLKFFTGGGRAGVNLPKMIEADVSCDGSAYYRLGDMVSLSEITPPPDDSGYHAFVFACRFQPVRARYVRLRVALSCEYFAANEFEVFKAADGDARRVSDLPPALDDKTFFKLADNAAISSKIRQNLLKLAPLAATGAERDKLIGEIKSWNYAGDSKQFNGLYPHSDIQRRIFAVNAKNLRQDGAGDLRFAVTGFYSRLSPVALPEAGDTTITQVLRNGEKRGAALAMLNTGDRAVTVGARLIGLKGTLHNTAFLDSEFGFVTSTVLLPHAPFEAIPGLVYQITVTFEPENLPPGEHSGILEITCGDQTKQFPVRLKILPEKFPARPRLHCSGWEYLDTPAGGTHSWQGTPRTLFDSFRRLRRDSLCFGTVGMSSRERALWPTDLEVDKDGNLLEKLNLAEFDDWIARNPDAGYYGLVAMGVSFDSKFGKNLSPGTPAFARGVEAWAKLWNDHIVKSGLKGRVFMQILDEPGKEEHYQTIQHWHTAFHKGAPDIPLFTTPCWNYNPEWNKYLNNGEILCPEVELLREDDAEGARRADAFRRLQNDGHVLHVYSCSFGPFLGEPGAFRNQAWLAFSFGAVSSNFWGSTNMNGRDCFNRYISNGQYYSPFFILDGGLVTSKHDAAQRDGVQDFEYLADCRDLLDRAQAQGADVAAHADAFRKIVKEVAAPRAMFSGAGNDMAEKAETARKQIIAILEQVGKVCEK